MSHELPGPEVILPSPLRGGWRREASPGGGVDTAVMTITRARQLRKSMTDAERRLWSRLRVVRVGGSHFRKQTPIGPYIVDFCCHGAKLVVEIDGGQHGSEHVRSLDTRRTAWLVSRGYKVIRYWNNEVLKNADGVIDAIVRNLHPHPNPSPQGGGVFERVDWNEPCSKKS